MQWGSKTDYNQTDTSSNHSIKKFNISLISHRALKTHTTHTQHTHARMHARTHAHTHTHTHTHTMNTTCAILTQSRNQLDGLALECLELSDTQVLWMDLLYANMCGGGEGEGSSLKMNFKSFV